MSGNKSLLRCIACIALISSLWIVVTDAFAPVAITTPKVMNTKSSDTALFDVQHRLILDPCVDVAHICRLFFVLVLPAGR